MHMTTSITVQVGVGRTISCDCSLRMAPQLLCRQVEVPGSGDGEGARFQGQHHSGHRQSGHHHQAGAAEVQSQSTYTEYSVLF